MTADGSRAGRALFGSPGALEVRPGGVLALGADTAPFDPRDITSMLAAHVNLVRRLQPQQREAAMVLRREDITTLADLLGETATEVIDKLGTLMGATTAQRRAMVSLFVAGAAAIGLAASGAVTADGFNTMVGAIGAVRPPAVVIAADPVETPTNTIVIDQVAPIGAPTVGFVQAALSTGPATVEVFEPPTLATRVVIAAPRVSTPAPEAPAAPETGTPVDEVWAAPVLPPGIEIAIDPPIVEVGPPPVMVPALPTPAETAPTGGPGGPPTEVFEQPTIVIDPAAGSAAA